MNNNIKNKLDNFNINLLNKLELKRFKECKLNMMSKRACLLHLIDKFENLTYDLAELQTIIRKQEGKLWN